MLNEWLMVERGSPKEEIAMALRHADIHAARRTSTLRLQLGAEGHVACASPSTAMPKSQPKYCAGSW